MILLSILLFVIFCALLTIIAILSVQARRIIKKVAIFFSVLLVMLTISFAVYYFSYPDSKPEIQQLSSPK